MPYIGNVTTSSNVNGSQINNGTITGDKLSLPFDYDSATLYLDNTNNRVGILTASPSSTLTVGTGGVVSIPLASAATPSLVFNTDTNTGIYSPGADQLAISTGGSGRLFVDASGNVGVGVSTPSQSWTGGSATAQQLRGLSGQTTVFRINEAGGTYGDLQLVSSASAEVAIYNFANGAMRFGTNSTERLRITSAGLVGVGTSSPVGNFHVSSSNAYFTSIDLENTASTGRRYTLFSTTSLSGIGGPGLHVYDATASASRLFIDSSGRVGIGTSSPGDYDAGARTLVLAESTNSGITIRGGTTGQGAIYFADGTTGNEAFRGRIEYSHSSDSLNFGTAGTGSRVTLDSSGRLGIGTTSPKSILTTQGNIVGLSETTHSLQHYQQAASSYTVTSIDSVISGASGSLVFKTGTNWTNANAVEQVRIDSSGRLLVGTSSARSNFLNSSTFTSLFQVEGSGGGASRGVASLVNSSAGGDPPWLLLGFSRNGSVGGNTIVENNDNCGLLAFGGNDGSEFVNAAYITAEIDGTPGANDMPGRLIFATTADGASSPTERFRISSTGAQSSVIPGGSTLYPQFACRAWVNFNGTGTVAIRGSGNVSSITDSGVGNYTVNFTTAMVDANYSCVAQGDASTTAGSHVFVLAYTYTTSNVFIDLTTPPGNRTDGTTLSVAVFR